MFFFSLDAALKPSFANYSIHQLKDIIAQTIFQEKEAQFYLLPNDHDEDVSSPEDWRDKMILPTTFCDDIFVFLTAEYLKRELILVPIHKEDGHGGTGFIRITPRETSGNPFYFLYYVGVHYQSIIPVPNN